MWFLFSTVPVHTLTDVCHHVSVAIFMHLALVSFSLIPDTFILNDWTGKWPASPKTTWHLQHPSVRYLLPMWTICLFTQLFLCCLKKRNVNMESHWAAFTVHLYGCFSHEDGLWFPVDLFMDECRCFNYICAHFRLFGCLGEQPRACFQTSVSSSTSQTW